MEKFYITTAIDYPSGPPHLGHAYEKICADAVARWQRLKKKDVFFLTGTDEHGQKIAKYAQRAGKNPKEFVDETSQKFIQLCRKLSISNDDFVRTTEERHKDVARNIFMKIFEKGDIYKGYYEGLYCTDCETFYLEKELNGENCPVHKAKVEKVKEEGYFFRAGQYRERVQRHIIENPDFLLPGVRRNEVLKRLQGEVKDLSISRSRVRWGVSLPIDQKHVIYVWFDALINYISALNYPDGEKFSKYWPASLHLIGKDILWFHAFIWPAILMAADIELPQRMFVHGFINVGKEKLSKSKGITIDPLRLIEIYGSDALRYFLLREVSYGKDGDFSEDALIRRINSDLANDLGNFVYRVLTMVARYWDEEVPSPGNEEDIDRTLRELCLKTVSEVDKKIDNLQFSEALARIWKLIQAANGYIEETAPWALAKNSADRARLGTVLYWQLEALRFIATLLFSFIPASALKIWQQLGMDEELMTDGLDGIKKWGKLKPGRKVKRGEPLFPRIEAAPVAQPG
ncbi:methionine--tRNA ligase [candidate division NPL-UPA2 bacterium Unc8]|uniref:Methionine--tRNA ligase n=1 Tax=candidate division NPL-UPA2 bacterium Unc8 TaxID=1980939 RepID=A0A399FUU0_UNCN2|nr:MAG: methionine--tRNA ligase [candidate division NPL-UPA2 bacterium Unc8]